MSEPEWLSIAHAAVFMECSRRQARRVLTAIDRQHPHLNLLRRSPGGRPWKVNPKALLEILHNRRDYMLDALSQRVGNLEADVQSLRGRTRHIEKTLRQRETSQNGSNQSSN